MKVRCSCLYLCLHLELRAGDRERQDSGSQARRLSQEPAELHFRTASEQPIREQELAAPPQWSADLCGRPHHRCQEPAGLAGQVNILSKFVFAHRRGVFIQRRDDAGWCFSCTNRFYDLPFMVCHRVYARNLRISMLADCLCYSMIHLYDSRSSHARDKNVNYVKLQILAKPCSSLKPKSNQYLSLQQDQFSSVHLAGDVFPRLFCEFRLSQCLLSDPHHHGAWSQTLWCWDPGQTTCCKTEVIRHHPDATVSVWICLLAQK